ncbi:glycosyltransferase [Solibacillus silvestris]|uniref:glycosyltransferase n=1 Tax=Solibacillus silvestris TaxID=76853 RepID=UPI003F81E884
MHRLHFLFNSNLIKNFGGVETWASYFFPILLESNEFEIHLYYVDSQEEKSEKVFYSWESKNLFLHPINLGDSKSNHFLKNYLKYSQKVARIFKSNKIGNEDCFIYVGSIMNGFINMYLNLINLYYRKANKVVWVRSKSVGEFAQQSNKMKTLVATFLENSIINSSSLLVTNGYDTEKFYKKKFPNKTDSIVAIPNVISRDFLHIPINIISNRLKEPIVYAGRLHITKGFNYFEEISRCNHHLFEFIAYGNCENVKKIDTLYYKGSYSQQDLDNIFLSADIYVFLNVSSMAGGLSHSLLEAMSAGKVIIAWDNDVHNQVLNETNSWLVPEGNISKFQEILNEIYYDLKNRPGLVLNKREQVRRDSLKYMPRKHVEIFLNEIKKLKTKEHFS